MKGRAVALLSHCPLLAPTLTHTFQLKPSSQAVILVFEKTAAYTAGLIINKPTTVRLGDFEGDSPLLPLFADSRLHLGGDVGSDTMQMMHSRAVEGSTEIRAGVHMGGTAAVKAAIERGEMAARDVKWFTRYSGWGQGQLENECKRNVWCASGAVAQLVRGASAESGARRFPASVSADLVLQSVEHDGRHLWHQVMELLGGALRGRGCVQTPCLRPRD